MNLNGKLGKKTGGEKREAKQKSGGHGPPRLPLESPLNAAFSEVYVRSNYCCNVPCKTSQCNP